jgi:predicted RNA methylase
LSAYICSLYTKSLGYKQVIDIGSGDGRIAYCAKILGLDSYSIEIDDMLVDLQNSISKSVKVNFNPK